MTDHDPLERYFDDFGTRLRCAATGRTQRPLGRRRLALASALGVVAIGVTALALDVSGTRLDPVAEARAALAAPGEIIYMKITSTSDLGNAGAGAPPQTTEQWSGVAPPRWRVVQTLPPPGSPGGTMTNSDGPITPISGRVEMAYGGGEQRQYIADSDTLTVQQGFTDDGPAARVPSVIPASSGDVETDLRAMLTGGEVTDEGEQQADGRQVRRFVIVRRRGHGDGAAEWRFVYDVDPETYAPIGATVTLSIPDRSGEPQITTRIHVDEYKKIPLNATTATLLEIQTTPQTKITVHTPDELHERERRMREQCRPSPDGDVACPPPVLQTPGNAP
jgi:hypothetical protein